jgi:hypothetical protein
VSFEVYESYPLCNLDGCKELQKIVSAERKFFDENDEMEDTFSVWSRSGQSRCESHWKSNKKSPLATRKGELWTVNQGVKAKRAAQPKDAKRQAGSKGNEGRRLKSLSPAAF